MKFLRNVNSEIDDLKARVERLEMLAGVDIAAAEQAVMVNVEETVDLSSEKDDTSQFLDSVIESALENSKEPEPEPEKPRSRNRRKK